AEKSDELTSPHTMISLCRALEARHCALMPAKEMTLPHRSRSSANNRALSAGDCPPGVVDIACRRATTSGIRRTSPMASDTRLAISDGVLGGATMANQLVYTRPGYISAIAGTIRNPGNDSRRHKHFDK